jgi:putative ubiquitin-RnfH superfamily antitoxin RatB of RatAB toxin-antitoxin module
MTTQPEHTDDPTEDEDFVELAKKLFAVPKSEVDELRRKRDKPEVAEA